MWDEAEVARLLGAGSGYCIAPWVHLHVPTQGPVLPCCEAKTDLGVIDRDGLEGVWNGTRMRQFRLRMLADEREPGCWKCHEMEASGTKSRRQFFNQEYAHHASSVAATDADGRSAPGPVSWDLRFSNLCNFRCRMCWHGSSSRWFEDAKALGELAAPNALIRNVENPRRFLDELAEHLDGLESVLFAGGEPLLMEEHYLIVASLAERGLRKVRLVYNTNLSELTFQGADVLELWNKFDDITVKASVDGVGARGEFIRKGFDWEVFLRNAKLLRQRCPHVAIECGMTISVFNVLHLPELHRALVEEGLILPHQVRIHALQEPAHYSVKILTQELRQEATERIREHQAWVASWYRAHPGTPDERQAHVAAQLSSLEAFLQTPAADADRSAFKAMTARVDTLRGEDFNSVFPELSALMSAGAA